VLTFTNLARDAPKGLAQGLAHLASPPRSPNAKRVCAYVLAYVKSNVNVGTEQSDLQDYNDPRYDTGVTPVQLGCNHAYIAHEWKDSRGHAMLFVFVLRLARTESTDETPVSRDRVACGEPGPKTGAAPRHRHVRRVGRRQTWQCA
jgi:hypothetical protein